MAKTTTKSVNWAVDVAARLKGAHFPIDEGEARDRLKGLTVKGQEIESILDHMDFPIATPADLLHQISDSLE